MQRKIEPRDYRNYDYLDATVKKNRIEELTAHYAAMGWDCVGGRDDKIYRDVRHIVLRRPHIVAHKDELQLLQVYFETAWNRIGRAETNPCPKTLAAGLFFGFVSLAAIVFGLLGALEILKFIPYIWGYVLLGAGVIFAAIAAAVCAACYKRELDKTVKEAKRSAAEIERVYLEAAALTGVSAQAGEAAQTEAEDER